MNMLKNARCLCFLRLQKQGIPVVSAREEMDPSAGSDTADADHLACGVDVLELLERVVFGERPPVRPDQGVHPTLQVVGRP